MPLGLNNEYMRALYDPTQQSWKQRLTLIVYALIGKMVEFSVPDNSPNQNLMLDEEKKLEPEVAPEPQVAPEEVSAPPAE